jgi:hypothetical protein
MNGKSAVRGSQDRLPERDAFHLDLPECGRVYVSGGVTGTVTASVEKNVQGSRTSGRKPRGSSFTRSRIRPFTFYIPKSTACKGDA